MSRQSASEIVFLFIPHVYRQLPRERERDRFASHNNADSLMEDMISRSRASYSPVFIFLPIMLELTREGRISRGQESASLSLARARVTEREM